VVEGESVNEKQIALQKRWKAAIRWMWYQRAIDALIVLGIIGGIFLGYAHYFWLCIGSIIIVFFLAARRFYIWNPSAGGVSEEIEVPDYSEYDHGSSGSESDDSGNF
jgi:hypothetical protein